MVHPYGSIDTATALKKPRFSGPIVKKISIRTSAAEVYLSFQFLLKEKGP